MSSTSSKSYGQKRQQVYGKPVVSLVLLRRVRQTRTDQRQRCQSAGSWVREFDVLAPLSFRDDCTGPPAGFSVAFCELSRFL